MDRAIAIDALPIECDAIAVGVAVATFDADVQPGSRIARQHRGHVIGPKHGHEVVISGNLHRRMPLALFLARHRSPPPLVAR